MTRALAALATLLLSATAASATDTIRVALVEGARAAELRGTDIEVTELGSCAACPPGLVWRADVVRASAGGQHVEIDGRRAPAFRLTSGQPIRLNGREYPAVLELVGNGDGMAIVNELPLEDYVVGVLRAETSERWPLETLRAQAIVARTYAAYHRTLKTGKPYHRQVGTTASGRTRSGRRCAPPPGGCSCGRASSSRPSITRRAAATPRIPAPSSPRGTCPSSRRSATSSRPGRRTSIGVSTCASATSPRSCGGTAWTWARSWRSR